MLKKLKITVAISGLALSCSALANDSGWYVGGKIGASVIETQDQYYEASVNGNLVRLGVPNKSKTGLNLGVQAGYNFAPNYNTNVRLELDSTFRPEVKSTGKIAIIDYDITTKTTLYSEMINAYFDIETSSDLTPYLTAGIGIAIADVEFSDGYGWVSRTKTNLAWSVGAGIAYSINQNLDLDLGYRYLDAGKVEMKDEVFGLPNEKASVKISTHDVTLGLRYSF